MRGLFSAILVLFTLSTTGVSLAITASCPTAQGAGKGINPVISPANATVYECSNSAEASSPPTLGDLSPQGAQLNEQLCDSHCTYHALFPDDPDSPLLPVSCGNTPGNIRPFAVNGSAISQAENQHPTGVPYMGTGGNCLPLMVPQSPINIDQQKPPTVKVTKPSPSPSPSPH
jgi:hypothetical protein